MLCEGLRAASGQPTEMLGVKIQLLRKMTNDHLSSHISDLFVLAMGYAYVNETSG